MRIPAALDSWGGALRGLGRSLLVLVSYALGAPSLCDHAETGRPLASQSHRSVFIWWLSRICYGAQTGLKISDPSA